MYYDCLFPTFPNFTLRGFSYKIGNSERYGKIPKTNWYAWNLSARGANLIETPYADGLNKGPMGFCGGCC